MSFYEFLRTAPYIRLVLPFMAGILAGHFLDFPQRHIWIFYLLVPLLLILLIVSSFRTFHLHWLWGVILHVTMLFSGFVAFENTLSQPVFKQEMIIARGTIIENGLEKPSTYSLMVQLDAVNENGIWRKSDAKIFVSVQKKALKQFLNPNQRILIRGYFKEIRNFGNPFEFDYKSYMNRNGIYYRAYADSANWFLTGENSDFNLKLWALKLRNRLLHYFRQLNLSQQEFAVISALTVGDKSYLDDELKSAYVNSGTMHILAVSGMHVALLFWLLQQVTRPLMLWKRGQIIRAALGLVIIWIYALITGLTPSVVRASVMFSFLLLGETGNKKVNIYNTLAASALLLLIINPNTMFDAGFQLSYLAVLSIVVFYNDIYKWLYFSNRLLKYIWSMIAVSLAAQLLTLPLTLFYFHQFPNYFLLSNVIALPLSTIILYGSIAALVIAPVKFLLIPLGWLLKAAIWLMNSALIWVEHLPGSLTNGIPVSAVMAVSIFIVVVAVRIFIYNKKAISLIIILLCGIVTSASFLIKRLKLTQSHELVVFNTSGPLVILIRDGFTSYVLTNNPGYNPDRLIKPYIEARMISKTERINLDEHTKFTCPVFSVYKGFLLFGDLKAYIWNRDPGFGKEVKIDLLIISKVQKKEMKALGKHLVPDEILITSDVIRPAANLLKEVYLINNRHYHFLNAHGAWVYEPTKKNDK